MFAFALWDRARRRLLLARDRLGKKPLFYARARRHALVRLGAASDPRRTREVPRDVDLDAIDSFLQLSATSPHPLSAFAALRKLPPGAHAASGRTDASRPRRYWKLSLPPTARGVATSAEAAGADPRASCSRPRGCGCAATCRSAPSSPAASTRARWWRRWRSSPAERVKTFSIGFDVAGVRRDALRARGGRAVSAPSTRSSAWSPTRWRSCRSSSGTTASRSPTRRRSRRFYLAELTRRHVTVALNGDGGDESFAGYDALRRAHSVAHRLRRLGAARRRRARRRRLGGPRCARAAPRPGWPRRCGAPPADAVPPHHGAASGRLSRAAVHARLSHATSRRRGRPRAGRV